MRDRGGLLLEGTGLQLGGRRCEQREQAETCAVTRSPFFTAGSPVPALGHHLQMMCGRMSLGDCLGRERGGGGLKHCDHAVTIPSAFLCVHRHLLVSPGKARAEQSWVIPCWGCPSALLTLATWVVSDALL